MLVTPYVVQFPISVIWSQHIATSNAMALCVTYGSGPYRKFQMGRLRDMVLNGNILRTIVDCFDILATHRNK